MTGVILVAFASTYGSTREAAEAVAAALAAGGLETRLLPARKARSLSGARAVVLGAPLYLARWHREALQFLARHHEALAALPTAVFALGPLSAGDAEWQEARAQLDLALAGFPRLKPASVQLFGGRYDPARLRFPDSLIARLPASPLRQTPPADLRDWTAIRSWAAGLVDVFQRAPIPAEAQR
jgi:menaquinone-dependent protoporphyrinogen oxidase